MGVHRHAGQGQAEQGQRQADGEGMLARAEQVLDAGHELASMGGVREVLATEMLEALGVETSKSFSLIETGERL